MGTRCLTIVKNEKGQELVNMYRQMDGYPDGHGAELVEFLKGRKIINGIGHDDEDNFNGMGCLAAALVAHFKTECGNFYLEEPGTRGYDEEYIYTIAGMVGEYPRLECWKVYEKENLVLLKGGGKDE